MISVKTCLQIKSHSKVTIGGLGFQHFLFQDAVEPRDLALVSLSFISMADGQELLWRSEKFLSLCVASEHTCVPVCVCAT